MALAISPYLHPAHAHALRPRHHPARTLSLHDHILQAYLPYFTANHFRSESDVDLILDRWLRSNPDLLDPSLHAAPLRERDLRKALYLVLDCIEDSEECGEGPPGVAERLLMELDEAWVEELRYGGGRRYGSGGESKTQRMFRAVAEVSRANQSLSIGSVLRAFFLGWLHEIAEEEDAISLAGWCSGVMRSAMDGRDKEDCLRALLALRPDVEAELRGGGAAWMPLSRSPTRDWPRRRRAAGRLWWNDENDRRIRRLIDEDDYIGRAAGRRGRKLNLRLGDSYYDRLPRRMGRLRSTRSVDRVLRRSRSPMARILDAEDRYDAEGPGSYIAFENPHRSPRLAGSRIWELDD